MLQEAWYFESQRQKQRQYKGIVLLSTLFLVVCLIAFSTRGWTSVSAAALFPLFFFAYFSQIYQVSFVRPSRRLRGLAAAVTHYAATYSADPRLAGLLIEALPAAKKYQGGDVDYSADIRIALVPLLADFLTQDLPPLTDYQRRILQKEVSNPAQRDFVTAAKAVLTEI